MKQGLTLQEIGEVFRSGQGLLWVDIEAPAPADGKLLLETFRFHPLTVEDSLGASLTAPKVDTFEDHLFIVVHSVRHDPGAEVVDTDELDIYLGKSFVVSVHISPLHAVDEVLLRCRSGGRPLRHGSDFLAHELIDAVVDDILPTIDDLNERSLAIEDRVIADPRPAYLADIMNLKRSAIHLRRFMAPQKEVLNRLSIADHGAITDRSRLYFRDVYDHMVRIDALSEDLQELADSALRTHLSAANNRLQETIRVLSVLATIALPAVVIASIYGMNFLHIPELKWRYGYAYALGAMATLTAVLLGYLKYRRWF